MPAEFTLFKSFTNIEIAEAVAAELSANNIECHLQNNQQHYVSIVGYQPIEIAIGINIRLTDFSIADAVLEKYYAVDLNKVDKEHYLFQFSNEELTDVITNPYDWGQYDQMLAKEILRSKGITVNEVLINEGKKKKITQLSTTKKVSSLKIIFGYILAAIAPMFGAILGISIMYNRNILPNGERFYIHPEEDRRQGSTILAISVIWMIILLLSLFFKYI